MNLDQRIRSLVGIRYERYSSDPAVAVDCMTVSRLIYQFIGRARKEPDAWDFPMPDNYSEEGITREALERYHENWVIVEPGTFGAVLDLGDHIGVYIGNGDVIHCQRGRGVIITRASRLRQSIHGWYKLVPIEARTA